MKPTWAPKTTMTDVRSNFKYARDLMRQVDAMLKTAVTDYSEGGDLHQIANDLVAAATTLVTYCEERS